MQDRINIYFEAEWKGKFAKKVEWLQREISLNERSSLSSPLSLIVKAAKEKNKLSITNRVGESVCILYHLFDIQKLKWMEGISIVIKVTWTR